MTRPGPILVLLALFVPVACLLPLLIQQPDSWLVWRDAGRIGALLFNSLLLGVISSLVAIPAGTFLGLLFARYSFPGDRWLKRMLMIGLFVPLPVYAVAWQIVLGSWLPSFALAPGQVAWRPWRQGLLPAGVVHGLAAFPWVAWLTAVWLARGDSTLVELARIEGGESAVLRRVLWPRLRFALVGSLLWMFSLAFTEITITDAMMVRTFAEDVYTEIVSNPAGVPAALAVSLPVWFVAVTMVLCLLRPLFSRQFTDFESTAFRPVRLSNVNVTAFAWLVTVVAVGLPVVALATRTMSVDFVGTMLAQIRTSGPVLIESLAAAMITGVGTACLAWWLCWRLGRTHAGAMLLIAVAVTLWLLPGPILGFGMKQVIALACDLEEWILKCLSWSPDFPPLRSALYDQPSPLPAMLAAVLRFFPFAVVVLLPAVRQVPVELLDMARVEGLGRWAMFHKVVRPICGPAAVRAAVLVGLLALGEVSAGKLVNPPARRAFILDLFNQMHYGPEAGVAALALIQIIVTAIVVVTAMAMLAREERLREGSRPQE